MQGNPKIKSIGIVSFLVILMAMLGCAEKEIKLPEDKFFAEWKTKADTSTGHSPSPVKRSLAVPPSLPESNLAPGSPVATASQLAKQKISLTMHGAEVQAVLRALARAVDQNIMINDQVRGRIDVSLKGVPWDQAFLGILRTHGPDLSLGRRYHPGHHHRRQEPGT